MDLRNENIETIIGLIASSRLMRSSADYLIQERLDLFDDAESDFADLKKIIKATQPEILFKDIALLLPMMQPEEVLRLLTCAVDSTELNSIVCSELNTLNALIASDVGKYIIHELILRGSPLANWICENSCELVESNSKEEFCAWEDAYNEQKKAFKVRISALLKSIN